jgi:hypothetical protein
VLVGLTLVLLLERIFAFALKLLCFSIGRSNNSK